MGGGGGGWGSGNADKDGWHNAAANVGLWCDVGRRWVDCRGSWDGGEEDNGHQ